MGFGFHHSPINLDTAFQSFPKILRMELNWLNSSGTNELKPDKQGIVELKISYTQSGVQNRTTIDGEEYIMDRLHFHNPSEHTFNGITMDGELHIVHINANDSSKYLVVAVPIAQVPEYVPLIGNIDKLWLQQAYANPYAFLPLQSDSDTFVVYVYIGSLTTPIDGVTYAGRVTWVVFRNLFHINEADWGSIFPSVPNAREVQAPIAATQMFWTKNNAANPL